VKQDHTENETKQISSTPIPANKFWRNEYDTYLNANIYDGIDAYSDTESCFFLDGFKWSLLVSMGLLMARNKKSEVKLPKTFSN